VIDPHLVDKEAKHIRLVRYHRIQDSLFDQALIGLFEGWGRGRFSASRGWGVFRLALRRRGLRGLGRGSGEQGDGYEQGSQQDDQDSEQV
jgi:hypothetical protein